MHGSSVTRGRANEMPRPVLHGARLVVGRDEGHRQEEGSVLGRVSPDEGDALPRQHIGLVVARVLDQRPSVGAGALVLVDLVAPHAIGGVVHQAVPLGPARRVVGGPLEPVAVEVLPDVRRHVAGPVEPDRQVLVGVESQDAAAALRIEAEHVVVVRVLPGEVGGTRRAAERVRDKRACERDAGVADQPARAAA